jgi:hypothetical protein
MRRDGTDRWVADLPATPGGVVVLITLYRADGADIITLSEVPSPTP